MLNSNCSTSIINLPTRVTSSSATVFDHIITNENRHEIIPSVIDYDITDHYPVMAIINRNVTSNPSQLILSGHLTNSTAVILSMIYNLGWIIFSRK